VSLNIKNPEAHKLARELAECTGESLTEAVTLALRERLERVQKKKRDEGLHARLMWIAEDAAKRMREPYKSIDHADLLYDELGLPK
jgi:antitoxin VapB